MTDRDHRYELIKPMMNDGKIQTFNDIFKFIPKTVVATSLGKKVDRFTELMNKVEKFTVEDLFTIARFCSLTEGQILQLVEKEYLKTKSKIIKPKVLTK